MDRNLIINVKVVSCLVSTLLPFIYVRTVGLTGFTTSSTLPGVRNVLLQGGEANAKLPAHSKALAVAPAPIPQLAALVLESTPTSTNLLPNLSPHPNLGMSIAGNVTAPRKRLGMGRATVGYPNKKFKSPES